MPYIFTWTIFLFLLKRASSIFRFSIPNIQAGNLVKIVIIQYFGHQWPISDFGPSWLILDFGH